MVGSKNNMLPDDIIKIIQKYESEDEKQITKINYSIKSIVEQLKSINKNISNELCKLMNNYQETGNEDLLLEDSKKLKGFINNIKIIETNYHEEEVLDIPNPVKLYLWHDNVCPSCNHNMDETKTSYSSNNYTEDQTTYRISTYRCPVCNRYFVKDDEIESIDLEKTNLILNEKYLKILDLFDVIVINTIGKCMSKNHRVDDIMLKVPVVIEDGTVKYITVPGSRCNDCNQYAMLKNDFNNINGVILCEIVDETTNNKNHNFDDFDKLLHQSKLYKYGYNVESKKNLSEKQRQVILASVFTAKVLSKAEIRSHLTTLITRGKKIDKWKQAVSKWESDLKYIDNFAEQDLPSYIVNKITLRYNRSQDE